MITHEEALRRAQDSVKQAAERAQADAHRPAYHAVPPVCWMNDPNGLIHYRGAYHLYYQHNPYSVQWGNIHWAHLKSSDLIHWEHLPIALAPSEPYDRDGCFSGSAVEYDGKLYVFYTANRFVTPAGLPDGLLQQQCLAVSEDGGTTFRKYAGNPVIQAPPEEIGQTNHFRDPKVWKHGDTWYMVVGTKKDGRGKVLLYRSGNLTDWDFFSVLTESDGTMGHMHECPDLFRLGDKDILLISPEGVEEGQQISGYYVGELDYETGAYRHGTFRRLDEGFSFYAPQTNEDAKGRRLLFGWMPMNGHALGKSWAGSMTIPRELRLSGDHRVLSVPAEELKRLRREHVEAEGLRVPDGGAMIIPGLAGSGLELIAEFDLAASDAEEFGVEVLSSEDGSEKTVLGYRKATGEALFDRMRAGAGPKGVKRCKVDSKDRARLRLHVFLDRSTVELFVNDGEHVMSGFVFPKPGSTLARFYAKGGTAAITRIDGWRLACEPE